DEGFFATELLLRAFDVRSGEARHVAETSRPVLLGCGIGRQDSFFARLERNGSTVVREHGLAASEIDAQPSVLGIDDEPRSEDLDAPIGMADLERRLAGLDVEVDPPR